MKHINILLDTDHYMIINKPAGLAVQGGKGINYSLDDYFKRFGAVLVHRLDRDTSGVLLAAKAGEANRFSRIFGNERKAVKLYTAICAGSFAANSAGSFAAKNAGQSLKAEGVFKDELLIRGSMKKSETRYKLIKSGKLADIDLEFSVVELELGTGRMHQIRRHLAMNGSPVLGDDKYGDFQLNKKLRKSIGLKNLLLHASRLIIKDQFDIDITAPLPDYFRQFTSEA